MERPLGLIGAPTSAGAFSPGQEDAPAALRGAGLVPRLARAGVRVVDCGDIPCFRWRPDRAHPAAMNLGAVRSGVLAVADLVDDALRRDLVPLVVGGDCTVELGTVLGWQRHHDATPLLYVDPHPDLNTPATVPDGALDWTGLAHMLAAPALVDLGGAIPALDAGDVVLFGHSQARATPAERRIVAERRLAVVAEDAVAADPPAAANRARELLTGRGPLLVHLDADSIDFADLPLAENTDRNVGLRFDTLAAALDALLAGTELGALTITEINPHHGEPGGTTLGRFLDRLVPALASAS